MNKFKNSVAVVTGAGSGIGRHLALKLASYGASLAISDINVDGLAETKAQATKLLKNSNARIVASALDVSNREAVFAYAEEIKQEFGSVNLVINNAGVALSSGTLSETSIDDFEWLMSINFSGVLYGTKAFLPILEEAEWGHIVNISSLFGLIGVAEQSAYNASKFAVRGMTEALRQELDAANSHISCTSIHPGGVKTQIAKNSRLSKPLDSDTKNLKENFEDLAMTTPDSAAEQILTAVLKKKRRLILGKDAKFLDWVQRHFPSHYQRVAQWTMRRALDKLAKA
ncbi:MAG: NADP-dependent 3-hydroxy acid dehydrogenase YdfG [Arenicella sp.]|jgi:NADP-dependent 3-hydroxy acid dehydrogenase YdfG